MDTLQYVSPLLLTRSYTSKDIHTTHLNTSNVTNVTINTHDAVINQITNTTSSSQNILNIDNLITSDMPFNVVTLFSAPNVNINTLQITGTFYTGTFRANSIRVLNNVNVPTVSTTNVSANQLNTSADVKCTALYATGMNVPSLSYTGVNTQQTVFSTGVFYTTTASSAIINNYDANTSQSDTTTFSTLNTSSLQVPSGTISTSSLNYSELSTPNYTIPQTTSFRGALSTFYVGYGKNIPATTLSCIMTTPTGSAYSTIIGYNPYLGTFDNATGYGGNKAILSLSNKTAPYRTLRYETTGNLRIYSTPSTVLWESGTSISDSRMKENIKPVTNAMDIIMKLKPVSFEYTGDAEGCGKSVGLIVEDTEPVFPYCVRKTGVNNSIIDLTKLVPLLVAGYQELKQRDTYIKNMQAV